MRALAFLALTGCLRTTEFKCATDTDCSDGKCETTTSYCSFTDSSCGSGRRYGDFSGSLTKQCVGGDIDGGIDVPPGVCPAGYTTLPNAGSHKYKVTASAETWTTQRDRCASEATNIYLALPDDMAELTAIVTATGARTWVGINDTAAEGTYVNVKNMPQTFLPWASGQPDNVGSMGGEDCVAALAPGQIFDDKCSIAQAAICECE